MEGERYPGNKLCKTQPKVDDPIPSHGRWPPWARLHAAGVFLD